MPHSLLTDFPLYAQHTFESFIVTHSNRYAYHMAYIVADTDDVSMNGVPLLLCGSKGVGKSHLLQAIGNRIKRDSPNARLQFWYCGNWIADLCRAIRNEKEDDFFAACSQLDVLLIDGEDFDCIFRSMPECKEKFLLMLSRLAKAGKRIAMTDSTIANESKYLKDYFFDNGQTVFINPLDFDIKTTILRHKINSLLPIFSTNNLSKDFMDEFISDAAKQNDKNIYELTELLMLAVRTAL